jgi:hypothetical protein
MFFCRRSLQRGERRSSRENNGPEIWWQLYFHSIQPDAFVAGVGTGGTIMGVGPFMCTPGTPLASCHRQNATLPYSPLLNITFLTHPTTHSNLIALINYYSNLIILPKSFSHFSHLFYSKYFPQHFSYNTPHPIYLLLLSS